MKGKEHHEKHHKAGGGEVYEGKGSNVDKEAMGAEPNEKDKPEGNAESEGKASSRKRGGKVEGKMAKRRMDRPMRARGGSCAPGMAEPKKHGGHVKEHERPGRKAGGRVGADKAPLTEAANSGKPRDRHLMTSGMEP
jgi:hypothetical protein